MYLQREPDSRLKLTAKETNILGLKEKIVLAEGLIKKGARPSIVRAVCQIDKASSLQLHKEIMGERPKPGLLPYDEDWIAKSPNNTLHASVYCNIYDSLSQNTRSVKGNIYYTAWCLYDQVFTGKPKHLDINRAWHIGQQLIISYVASFHCDRCQSTYVAIKTFPGTFRLCPICDSMRDVTGNLRWKQQRTNARVYREHQPSMNL